MVHSRIVSKRRRLCERMQDCGPNLVRSLLRLLVLDLSGLESRGKSVDDLLGTLGVLDDKSVEVARATDLELGDGGTVLLDGDGLDVLTTGEVEESLDVGSLTL